MTEPTSNPADLGQEAAAGAAAADDEARVAGTEVKQVDLAVFAPSPSPAAASGNLDLLLDVDVEVSAEIGARSLPIEQLLALGPGAVVELDRTTDQPVDLKVNGKTFARGEVVVVGEHFGVRVTEILKPTK